MLAFGTCGMAMVTWQQRALSVRWRSGCEMSYLQHLKANWEVAGHSFLDFLEHFLHGLCPAIKWEHKQGVKNHEGTNTVSM